MKIEDLIKERILLRFVADDLLIKKLLENFETDLRIVRKMKLKQENSRVVIFNYCRLLKMILQISAKINHCKIFDDSGYGAFLSSLGDNTLTERVEGMISLERSISDFGEDISLIEARTIIPILNDSILKIQQKYLKDIFKI